VGEEAVSSVTNIILTFSPLDDGFGSVDPPGKAAVKLWCLGQESVGWPESADVVAGGRKHLECAIYIWAVNYLDEKVFLDVLSSAPWHYPETVQVFIQGQNDSTFKMMTLQQDRTWIIYSVN
jgi:hypothetical protein